MRQKIIGFLNRFELYMMVFLMLVFCLNIFAQVFCRIIFNYPLFFAEEVSRYAFLWMVFLGISYAVLYDKHIRVTFLTAKLPEICRNIMDIFLHLLAVAVFAWVFFTSLEFLAFSRDISTPALRISKSLVALILPISAMLTIIRSIQKIILIIRAVGGKKGDSGTQIPRPLREEDRI